jgi:hypothetical protein
LAGHARTEQAQAAEAPPNTRLRVSIVDFIIVSLPSAYSARNYFPPDHPARQADA